VTLPKTIASCDQGQHRTIHALWVGTTGGKLARHQGAPPLERFAEGGLALDPLGFGVDIRETYLHVLGPERHEPRRITSKLRSPALVS
jgi:hypothetical protein